MPDPRNRISGKTIGGTIGGNAISGLHKYDVTDKADELDGTVGADGGFTRNDTGCGDLTLTIYGYFDLAEAKIAPVARGAWVLDLKVYDETAPPGGGTPAPFLTLPRGKVMQFQKAGEVRGRLEFTCTIKNWGPYSYTESPG